MRKIRESEIQAAILGYLATTRLLHWRTSLGARLAHSGKRLVFAKNPMKGFPDISGVFPDGKFFCIEVKVPGGRCMPEQHEWAAKLSWNGVPYCVATSVEDVKCFLALHRPREDDAAIQVIAPREPELQIPFRYKAAK